MNLEDRHVLQKQSALRWLSMFVAKLFPEDYYIIQITGLKMPSDPVDLHLMVLAWMKKLLVALFWNSTGHRTIIQILSRPFKQESSSLSSFPSHLSALIVFLLFF